VNAQGIRAGSIITLKIDDGTVPLNFKTEHGTSFKLVVMKDDTIAEVKDKIQEKESIPKDKQRLFKLDEELEDEKTVKASGLQKESAITVKAGTFLYVADTDCKILFSFYA
jgi:hypothetical protein